MTYKPSPIIKGQSTQIHVLISQAGIDHDLYMEMLANRYPASVVDPKKERALYLEILAKHNPAATMEDGIVLATCKKLSYRQAAEFIAELKEHLRQNNYKKYEELGDRPGMAKPAQLRKIDAMWSAVTRQTTQKDRNKALNRWLDHHFHVSHMKFVEDHQVGKIVASLRAMKFQKEREVG